MLPINRQAAIVTSRAPEHSTTSWLKVEKPPIKLRKGSRAWKRREARRIKREV